MDSEKTAKPLTRRPMVLRKLNTENLLMIERGLLGDLPEKLRPQPPVPVRGRPTELAVSKSTSFLSACLPVIPDSPGSDRLTPSDEGGTSPLKKTFSFRETLSRMSFLSKKDKKWKKITEETSPLENTTVQSKASKRSWFFRHRQIERREKTNLPIYKRSKSFEFLPRAIEEEEETKDTNNQRMHKNSQSFIYGSSDPVEDAWASNYGLEFLSPTNTNDGSVFTSKNKKTFPFIFSKGHDSSISTMTSTNSSGYTDIFKRESVQDLLEELDKAVDMFSENYLSDCEPYTKSELIKMQNKRKSLSFSTLPSPKIVQLNPSKVSAVSADFKKELSVILSAKQDSAVVTSPTNRRGSVTDCFLLEDKTVSDDKYRRALKKPTNRVRRMSSTKYWITTEQCAVYSREQRPPLVIPRITQYRGHRDRYVPNTVHTYPEDFQEPTTKVTPVRQYDRLQEWSPTPDPRYDHEQYGKINNDSPRALRLMKNSRLAESSENLLIRRPNQLQLQLPASSSGDSLDVEVRERCSSSARSRKSKSMMGPKYRVRSPIPTPRMLLPNHESSPSGSFQASVVYEGAVKRTKFSENTKKCKKNWTECYMLLTHTGLNFFKDQKSYYASKYGKPAGTPPSPSEPRAELSLMLHNAHIVPCSPTHTRRYSRSLVLKVDKDQYLLQEESAEAATKLFNRIMKVIYKLNPLLPILDYPTPQSHSSNTDLESNGRTPPPSARLPHRSKQKASGSSNEEDPIDDKSHIKSRLRKFFAKRPSMEVLVKNGIYKDEPVFGQNLEKVCPTSSPRVPEFVVSCIREIERSEENMSTDGLYRASGNLSQVQKIRLEIDQNNLTVIENHLDIHVLTGSLKLFFRELKEPLLPCSVFDRVLSACSIKRRESRITEFRDIINSLPQCNRDTLKYLLEHLLRVTQYSEHNRMHTANLAIVFGPTLLWAPAEQAHNIAVDCIQQNNVVDILLTDFNDIFKD